MFSQLNILKASQPHAETTLSRFTLKSNTGFLFPQAAQIMFGLIHSALGYLWLFLYHVEDAKHSVGPVLMTIAIVYLFVSGSFVSKLWHYRFLFIWF